MSRYRIEYFDEALEDAEEIPANLRGRVKRAVEQRLARFPNLYGERLRKGLLGLWKIRVGDWRVVFEILDSQKIVRVWAIRHRRNVYPEAARRWARA